MKEYKIELPDRIKEKAEEIKEYLIVWQYQDDILKSGACANLLKIKNSEFLVNVLPKYDIPYTGKYSE